jgi:hypothetical protein
MSEQIMQDIEQEELDIQELELNANHWYSINH